MPSENSSKKRVNLLTWSMNSWYYNRFNDSEISSTDSRLANLIIKQPWFNWTQEEKMKIEADSHYSPMEDMNTYIAYTTMLPQQETYWLLKWGPSHIRDPN